jgi:DNA topoisomerase-1
MQQTWLSRRGTKPGHFKYATLRGKQASARRAEQIDALAIPPAWSDVHIAVSDRSAIQAWGFDARGRKQYRYHPSAVKRGQLRKYYRVRQMARDLPAIRRRVNADFRRRAMPRAKVSAAIVRFLSDGFFRIGNDRYAKENGTFGLTTLKKSHVSVDGDLVVFDYVGKRSIRHRQTVVSRELARFVTSLLKVPGRRLFRYQDDEGEWHNIESAQINQYLQDVAGFPYSAKDFRTWGGTLRAATVLADVGPADSEREAKRNVATAIRLVAAELGNTPTICRKSYVHPVVVQRYLDDGDTIQPQPQQSGGAGRSPSHGAHTPEESALIEFLDEHFPDRRKQRRTDSE